MSTRSESPEPSEAIASQSKHHGSGRHWTKEETGLLEKHHEEYREVSDSDCLNIVSEVLGEMLDILPNGRTLNKEERVAVKKVSTFPGIHYICIHSLFDLGYQSVVCPVQP